jgi:hypothetical protein
MLVAWLGLFGCAGEIDSGSQVDAGANAADATPADTVDGAPDPDAAIAAACEWGNPQAPADSGVLWAAPLTLTGEETLGGHGHNDGNGPVGHCAGTPVAGQPFYRLIAAGFETDENTGGGALPADFWRNAQEFTGYGESGGRVHVYIDVVDENGQILNGDSTPDLRVRREAFEGPTDLIAMTSKPLTEFQTNFNMVGGGARYAVSIEGASDKVINMRLPVNHHVCYMLIFQREQH